MPIWQPTKMWLNQEAFIIGGGPSLRGFDWSLLHGENTIGCNNAFRLGYDVCKICIFVDDKFIYEPNGMPRRGFYDELAKFPGLVVTNNPALRIHSEPWLMWMPRKATGLHLDALGYNYNCGASAINLALLLGATTIYLLGFDMHLDAAGNPNYHNYIIDKPSSCVYERMLSAFTYVGHSLAEKFPGCSVYNINKDSNLLTFPILDPDIFWAERKSMKKGGNHA